MAGPAAYAQEQAAPAPPEMLQEVVVTGTLIKRADFDTPSPLQVLSVEDLQNSGYTSISDVLRTLSANGQGTLTQTNPFSFAGGASGVALRGLTVGATLTLIDGERMVAYPLTDDGQRTFVDTSSIPFSVVERVEVLKDGASSEYGSDAIAGVVNVIIKKSFNGFEFSAEAGQTASTMAPPHTSTALPASGSLIPTATTPSSRSSGVIRTRSISTPGMACGTTSTGPPGAAST
jgi:iron complex outermembrane receptor protein